MNKICILESFETILLGIISNILFTLLLVYFIQKLRYYFQLHRHFNKKIFKSYYKRFPDEVVHTIVCEVKGNRILFKGEKHSEKDNFEGEFIINPINLKIGEGFHYHKDSDGFAFLKIIIKDNSTFLVDAPYTKVEKAIADNKIGSRIYQSFVWKKN